MFFGWNVSQFTEGAFFIQTPNSFITGMAPFGYKRNGNRLELDLQYSSFVKEIFNLYIYEDWGLQRIAKHLTKLGVPTPRTVANAKNAGALWQQSSVKVILTNPIYTGNMIQNRSEVISIRNKSRRCLPQEQQTIVANTHPALITKDEFEEVQAKLAHKGKRRSNGQESLFAHLAVCGDCGTGMHYKNDRKAYQCGRYGKYGKEFCSHHFIKADKLLYDVLIVLKELTEKGINKSKLIEVAKKEAGKQTATYDVELKDIKKRMHQLTKKQSTLLDLLNDNELTREEWKVQNEVIRNELVHLTTRRQQLQSYARKEKDMESQLHVFEK